MMIPLSKDAKYEYKHPVSGIVYLLKYVTDAERIEFQKEQKKVLECSSKLAKLAKTIENLSDDEKESLPQELLDDIQKAENELYEHQKWIIDYFITGWKHDTIQLPEFNMKPSTAFKINEIPVLAKEIQSLIPVLTGLSVEDAKN
mgnify:FL=1|jgi:16S rRNA C967 or C1407 C5-methylase (RsmB/RsmF family)